MARLGNYQGPGELSNYKENKLQPVYGGSTSPINNQYTSSTGTNFNSPSISANSNYINTNSATANYMSDSDPIGTDYSSPSRPANSNYISANSASANYNSASVSAQTNYNSPSRPANSKFVRYVACGCTFDCGSLSSFSAMPVYDKCYMLYVSSGVKVCLSCM